ncbi:MAG: hypothetical protein HN577_11515 [Rhodospirillaceae bacterium]|nr:hypothetical protein [Rhodospirillaceae bacterium]
MSLAPDELNYLNTLAHVLAALGRPDDSVALFERVLPLGVSDAITYYRRGLQRRGYDTGSIDGVWTPDDQAALEACAREACNLVGD